MVNVRDASEPIMFGLSILVVLTPHSQLIRSGICSRREYNRRACNSNSVAVAAMGLRGLPQFGFPCLRRRFAMPDHTLLERTGSRTVYFPDVPNAANLSTMRNRNADSSAPRTRFAFWRPGKTCPSPCPVVPSPS